MKKVNESRLINLKHMNTKDLSKYVRMCYDAMRRAKDFEYYVNSEITDNSIFERNFIISLAYLMGKNAGQVSKPDYLIGGEVSKNVFDESLKEAQKEEKIDYTAKKLEFAGKCVAPDFIIHKHKNYEDMGKGGQKLILESKTKGKISQKEFNRDFFKLNLYISRLDFKDAVYLIIGKTANEIDSYISTYLASGYYYAYNYNRIHFLIQDTEKSSPGVYGFVMKS